MNNTTGQMRMTKNVKQLDDGTFMIFKDHRKNEKDALILDRMGFTNLMVIQPPTNWYIECRPVDGREPRLQILFSKASEEQRRALNKDTAYSEDKSH